MGDISRIEEEPAAGKGMMEARFVGGSGRGHVLKVGTRFLGAATVVCLIVAAACAVVVSSSHGLIPNDSLSNDMGRVLRRVPRSLPPSSLRREAVEGLFCGDSVMECGPWFNRLFPLRIYALINNFYAHFMGETGPTKIHELERKRLTLLLEYYKQKYNRTKRLLDLEHEELLAQAKLEDEKHEMRLQILQELLETTSNNTTDKPSLLNDTDTTHVQGVNENNVTMTNSSIDELTS